jgi:K+-sensing histidine kinase KdpD
MSTPVTLSDIEKQKQTLLDISAEFANTRDPDQIAKITERLNAATEQLHALLNTLKAQCDQQVQEALASGRALPRTDAVVEVVLTPEQRAQVKAETGADIETLTLPDPGGARSITMPYTDPDEILTLALASARQRQAEAAAHANAQAAAQAALADFQKDAPPEALALLEKAKEDPNFLGGLLKK